MKKFSKLALTPLRKLYADYTPLRRLYAVFDLKKKLVCWLRPPLMYPPYSINHPFSNNVKSLDMFGFPPIPATGWTQEITAKILAILSDPSHLPDPLPMT